MAYRTMDSVLVSHPAALGLILDVPDNLFRTEIYSLKVAEILREWTVQRLIDDQTHLVLNRGKLVLQKY